MKLHNNLMAKASKYLTIFILAARHSLKNYKALIGLSIFLLTCMLIFAHLLKIAAFKTGAANLDPDMLLWYIAFNEWVLVSLPDVQDDMEMDLRSGRLAYLLPRPVSYVGSTFVDAFAALCVNLFVLGIVTFAFTWACTGTLPLNFWGMLVSIAFGILAGCLCILFQMLIGLSAFWLQEVGPFFWLWEKLLFMLGGLMLPLSAYPEWLQSIARLSPFPAILGDRSALALDFNAPQILSLCWSLAFWGILGITCLILVYRKGLRILNIEGG